MRTGFLFLSVVTASLLVLSCKKNVPTPAPAQATQAGDPIVVDNGRVRFYIALSEDKSLLGPLGLESDLAGHSILVNGKNYAMVKDASGAYCTEVAAADDQKYNAVLLDKDASQWYATDPAGDLFVPFSQFYSTTRRDLLTCPRFASYSEKTGNLLCFSDAMSVLQLTVSGTSVLSSVKVEAVGGELLTGVSSYDFTPGGLHVNTGLDEVVVNCTESGAGVPLSMAGVTVPVFIAPGNYSQGLEVTLCSMDHKMMRYTLPACTLAAGESLAAKVFWAPANDMVFYEGFDNFVWGGDIIGGKDAVGFSPDAKTLGIDDGLQRDGYAAAMAQVAYNKPGTGFIQSSNWTDVKDGTVATSHAVTKSYVQSRNIGDWTYLFRCQEFHGVLGVGTGNSFRGVVQLPALSGVVGMVDVRVSFKLCFQPGVTDDIVFQVINAGHISNVKLDSRSLPIEVGYELHTGNTSLDHTKVSMPATLAEPKTWHEVEITVNGVTDATQLYLGGASTGSGTHGFYLDDICVKSVPGSAKKGNLRLMYWNIQNGMWADQQADYANFVAFVNRYDPDICVWCEAETIFNTGTDSYMSSSSRYLPSNWSTLASRYGHSYVANGGNRDDYSQEITSKYAITTVRKITTTNDSSKPVSHGAGYFQVTVNGRTLNIVSCHLWPKNETGSDEYRAFEMDYIVSQTVNNSQYASQQDWILVGDMNSWSRLDKVFYGVGDDEGLFLPQNVVLDKTNLVDVIAARYPAPQFIKSTYGKDRKDFIYLSPTLMPNVVRASIFTDSFTPGYKLGISNFSQPSDHRPFIVDFNL